jgi:hypothetical protein
VNRKIYCDKVTVAPNFPPEWQFVLGTFYQFTITNGFLARQIINFLKKLGHEVEERNK